MLNSGATKLGWLTSPKSQKLKLVVDSSSHCAAQDVVRLVDELENCKTAQKLGMARIDSSCSEIQLNQLS